MSEQRLEDNFIKELVKMGYEEVNVKNEIEMYDNLRVQLSKLNNIEITDEMFDEIKLKLNHSTNIVEKAKNLREMQLFKDEEGISQEFYLFDSKNWCKNIFQVTNQVVMDGPKHRNRYDVTILINGLPLVQIELKRQTVDYSEGLGQIVRYKNDTMQNSLYDFIQLFIVSNGDMTKYIANSAGQLNPKFAFEWKNENNEKIINLFEFAKEFLTPCTLGKYIAKYMIIEKETGDGQDKPKSLMAMRSYQVHAVEKIIEKVKEHSGDGYVWHTTGSGKTLTSFKVCELIAENKDIDKVIFVVDRSDLDTQTNDEYRKFRSVTDNNLNNIQNVGSTSQLVEKINSDADPIIVTTIQKLNNAVIKKHYSDKLQKDRKVVLVFDECHRTQFGDMHQNIDEFFNQPQKFGFTGTPILGENAKTGNVQYATTKDVFSECLHTYLINDAIDDGNVLGFQIDYKAVLKDKNKTEENKSVYGIDTREVINHIEYLKCIAMDVLETYDGFTRNRKFNAMLATSGINNAIRLYKLLRGELVEGVQLEIPRSLKVATIYSYADNQDDKNNNRREMERIIDNYNYDFPEANYSLETFNDYKKNISTRMKSREIDLLIVSDMFLTGFDAKQLNTLYFDKEQKYHNLIQAISRTNRIYDGSKDYGNIICYHPRLEVSINDALALFSNENAEQNYLKQPYAEMVKLAIDAVEVLMENYPNYKDAYKLEGDEDRYKFVKAMRSVNRQISKIETYREFTYDDLPISEYTHNCYNTVYQDIYKKIIRSKPGDHESILKDVDFEIDLIKKETIDYDYIIRLLKGVEAAEYGEFQSKVDDVLANIKENPKLHDKYDLVKTFFAIYYNQDNYLSRTISDAIHEFNVDVEEQELRIMAKELQIEEEFAHDLYDTYHITNDFDVCLNMVRDRNETIKRGDRYQKIRKSKQGLVYDYVTKIKEKLITFM